MTIINASGLSEEDGDQLRDLLAAFTWRTSVVKEDYALARADGAVLAVQAVRRARWRAWSAATLQFRRAFDWTSVPSVVPAEVRELHGEDE